MSKTLPATTVRKQFFQLIQLAGQPGRTVTITVEGEPKVVMMSVEDFEGWQETLEIMSDKKLVKSLMQAKKEVKKGKFYTQEEVEKYFKIKK